MKRLILLILLITGLCALAARQATASELVSAPTATDRTSPVSIPSLQSLASETTATGTTGEHPVLHDSLAAPAEPVRPATTAPPPERTGKGWHLGLFIPYTSIRHDRTVSADHAYLNSLDPGAGLGVRAGYSMTAYAAIEWSLATTWHSTSQTTITGNTIEDQLLTATALTVRLRLPLAGSRWEPCVLGGIGYTWLGDDLGTGNTHYRGRQLQAGLGVEYHLPDRFSLTASIARRRIVFDSGQWMGAADITLQADTVDMGIRYQFN